MTLGPAPMPVCCGANQSWMKGNEQANQSERAKWNFLLEKNLVCTHKRYRGDLFECLSVCLSAHLSIYVLENVEYLFNRWVICTKFMVFLVCLRQLLHYCTPTQSPPARTGLEPGLFLRVYLLRGLWCYHVVSYHFKKHLTRQSKLWERIFEFGPRSSLMGYKRLQAGSWDLANCS